MGHFSQWLGVGIDRLRRINNWPFGKPLAIGQSLQVDFSMTSPEALLERRLAFPMHFIRTFMTDDPTIILADYRIKAGENLWDISRKRYKLPVNLLLYFNDLDKLERLYPGDLIKLPVIQR